MNIRIERLENGFLVTVYVINTASPQTFNLISGAQINYISTRYYCATQESTAERVASIIKAFPSDAFKMPEGVGQ